VVEAAP